MTFEMCLKVYFYFTSKYDQEVIQILKVGFLGAILFWRTLNEEWWFRNEVQQFN